MLTCKTQLWLFTTKDLAGWQKSNILRPQNDPKLQFLENNDNNLILREQAIDLSYFGMSEPKNGKELDLDILACRCETHWLFRAELGCLPRGGWWWKRYRSSTTSTTQTWNIAIALKRDYMNLISLEINWGYNWLLWESQKTVGTEGWHLAQTGDTSSLVPIPKITLRWTGRKCYEHIGATS